MAHKVGNVIVFHTNVWLEGVEVGKEYTIDGVDEDGDEYFIDSEGERNYAADSMIGIGTEGNMYAIVREGN